MKHRIPIFGLCLALVIPALSARAQENEPAHLPGDWDRIAKAVDMSLDQIQAVRTEFEAGKSALADWEKTNKDAFEALKKEAKEAQETQNADALRALKEKATPLMTARDAIRTNTEARLNAVLRPEQKATWAVVQRYDPVFRQMQRMPGLSVDQTAKLEAAFKDFTVTLGRWDAEKGAQAEALTTRDLANNKARHDIDPNGAPAPDKIEALKKEHKEVSAELAALRAERDKLADDGSATLFAILTPEQQLTAKAGALLNDLENKLERLNVTPEQMAAVKALCETESKAMTGMSGKDFSQARERLQRAIIAQVLTAEQKELAQGKKPADPAKAAPVAPAAP